MNNENEQEKPESLQTVPPANEPVLSERTKKRRELVLNGNLWRVIAAVSFPLIAINALTFLYTIVDSMMASSTSDVSRVVIISQICSMIISVGTGLSSGGVIIIARLVGRKDYETAKTAANTILTLAVCVAIIISVLCGVFAVPILKLFRLSDELISEGNKYFIIQIVVACVTMFNGIYFGFEKAQGKTMEILILNAVVMGVKIGLSALFVYAFKWGIIELGLATLFANLILTVRIVIRLASKKYLFRYSFKNKSFTKEYLKPILLISFPIFLGRFVFSLGKVFINSMSSAYYGNKDRFPVSEYGSKYGDEVVGALGISNNMGGYVTNVLNSVEESAGQIISANLGNKNRQRALRAFYYSLSINMGLALVGVLILSLLNKPICNFYSKGSPEFAEMISDIFKYEKIGIIALGINSSVLALLYGFGFTRMSLIINLSRLFVFRIPSLLIMFYAFNINYAGVGIAMLISNTGIGLLSAVIGVVYLFKIKRENITDRLKIGKGPDINKS